MKNDLSNPHSQQVFSFLTFLSVEEAALNRLSFFKMSLLTAQTGRPTKIVTSSPAPQTESVAPSVDRSVIICRYTVDDFGSPRILSRWEATLHVLARPVLLGVFLGYALAIAIVAFHTFPLTKHPVKAVPSEIAWQGQN